MKKEYPEKPGRYNKIESNDQNHYDTNPQPASRQPPDSPMSSQIHEERMLNGRRTGFVKTNTKNLIEKFIF